MKIGENRVRYGYSDEQIRFNNIKHRIQDVFEKCLDDETELPVELVLEYNELAKKFKKKPVCIKVNGRYIYV